MLRVLSGIISTCVLVSHPLEVLAAETITYTYDAKGRLVRAERSGSVNNNVKVEYEHDRASNRKRAKVTNAPN